MVYQQRVFARLHLSRIIFLLLLTFSFVINIQAQTEQVTIHPVQLTDAYITNPGMGWQHADGIGEQLLPETVIYPQRGTISWRILNPERDVFEWSILDTQIATAMVEGKQISFRIYTMRGESFGGHQLPDFVLEAGATLFEIGEPDYSNCVYQAEWGHFVDALRERYDGHPAIAFIDISGYGDFNEWGWLDAQTEWDDLWWEAYNGGIATPQDMTVMDSQARRRLADMFIGGAIENHECRDATGETQTIAYDYQGFQETQLVMPYAGLLQSTQYVFSRRPDVGFRYDCLGRADSDTAILERLGAEIDMIWRNAPVVFEICGYLDEGFQTPFENLIKATHGSIVHDNFIDEELRDADATAIAMRHVGYRYVLTEATFPEKITSDVDSLDLQMLWQNVGYAPSYPRMGQDFQLQVYLINRSNQIAAEYDFGEDISAWLPAEPIGTTPPIYNLGRSLDVSGLQRGTYRLEIAIINQTTQQSINLAIDGRNRNGHYQLGTIEVE